MDCLSASFLASKKTCRQEASFGKKYGQIGQKLLARTCWQVFKEKLAGKFLSMDKASGPLGLGKKNGRLLFALQLINE
jgi:hypothetical protein